LYEKLFKTIEECRAISKRTFVFLIAIRSFLIKFAQIQENLMNLEAESEVANF
jgi:hypothetical protein